jgi:hypothetical protein
LGREKFGDEVLVKRKDLLGLGALAAFRVEVVGIELANPLEHALVAVIHEMTVSAMAVGGVKRMIPEHVLGFFRDISARGLVDVFVVSKREVDLI